MAAICRDAFLAATNPLVLWHQDYLLPPRYWQMPVFENALGKSHLIIFRVTVMITFQDPHWSIQLLPWDRRPFRPQKANVNCQPSDPDEILQVNQLIPCQLTKVQKNYVSFFRSPSVSSDLWWWDLQSSWYVTSIQCISWPQILNNFLKPWWVFGPH